MSEDTAANKILNFPNNPRPKVRASSATKQNNYIEYAKNVLELEGQAVLDLAKNLDENFNAAVSAIMEAAPNAHIIVSGMGKAGFIGMKFSATLASTGVPSFFLHPAEAVHGDLGRYTKKDVAFMLSNSGETEEILKIIPLLKRLGCTIISLTANENSNLAKFSDIVLKIGTTKEAGPLGLAPTTSTTSMLALCDALAMTVLSEQGFSKEQFALYHPGGNLGRLLTPVSAIMRKDDEQCVVSENELTKVVIHQMTITKGKPGAASIVNSSGQLVGIFTDGDFRRCIDQDIFLLEKPVSQIMGKNPKTVKPDILAQEALKILSDNKIDQLIVVDKQNCPVGLLDVQDLIEIGL